MNKRTKDGIRLIIIMILIVVAVLVAFQVIRKKHEIPPNDKNVTGNTPSNLYNGGLFCESDDGKVYFSNSYDSGSLYVMNPDESEIKKLNKYYTKWINAAGDFLYFYENADGAASIAGFGGHMMGIYRSRKTGEDIKCLDKTFSEVVALSGSKVYYQHYTNQKSEGMTLYQVAIDKRDGGQVLKDFVNPACVYNGSIYYAGVNGDHNMYKLDTATDRPVQVYSGGVYNPVMVSGDTFYYMNVNDNYRIHRARLNSDEDERITSERVDCFNIAGSYVYYQANAEQALMRCPLDGGESEVVKEGIFTEINSTSRYVYFRQFDSETIMYRCPVGGPAAASEFTAARAAAAENNK